MGGAIRDSFWRDVLLSWSEFVCHFPVNKTQVKNQPLWLDSRIKTDKYPSCNLKVIEARLTSIEHIVKEDGQFKNCAQIRQEFGKVLTLNHYYAKCEVIDRHWKMILRSNSGEGQGRIENVKNLLMQVNPTAFVYNRIVRNPCVLIPRLN